MKTHPFTCNRRRFLQGSFQTTVMIPILAAATGVRSTVRSAHVAEPVRLGFVGTGSRGRDLLRAFVGLPGVRVTAVCDPFRDRRESARSFAAEWNHPNVFATADYRDVIERRDVDAVVIATQDQWHAPIAIAAARAGKAIYCEKPLGVAHRESRAIRDEVRRRDVVFQTGTQQRSDRRFRQACELARNGYLGRIHTIEVATEGPNFRPGYKGSLDPQPVPAGLDWELWLGPAPATAYNPGRHGWPDWYLIWDYCAGFIVNWGVHHLDIALWGCPELYASPFEIECRGTYRNEGLTDNIDQWHGTFTCSNGLKMIFSDHQQQRSGCRFIGEKGWVHVDRPTIQAEPASLLEVSLKDDDLHLPVSTNHGLDFIQAIREHRDPVSDVDAGHRAACFGGIAEIACRLQRKLTWDPVLEQFRDAPDANAMLSRPMRPPWTI